MSKQSGLGDNLYVGGNDLSGDISALSRIGGGVATLDVTDITQSANARLGSLRDGAIDFTAYMDPATSHPVLSALPTADVICTYCRGTAFASPAACLVGKQISYDPTRGTDGSLALGVSMQANAFGLEWGTLLTDGKRAIASKVVNGDFETGLVGNWTGTSTVPTLAIVTSPVHGGSDALSLTSTGAGTMGASSCSAASILTSGIAVVPGQSVLAQAWVRAASTTRSAQIIATWYDNTGTPTGVALTGSSVTDSSSAWTLVSAQGTAPASAAFFRVTVQFTSVAGAGEIHYVDDVTAFLTAGIRDSGASSAFGAQAYLQVFGFTGTDATVKIQHSTDGVTWSDVTGLTFAQITSGTPSAQRLATASNATINEFVQAVVVTTAGFSALTYAVVIVRNLTAVTF